MMNNFTTSLIRTYVPILVGSVVSYAAVRFGVEVPADLTNEATTMLTGALIGVYYLVARLLERKFPELGKLLLGSSSVPVYAAPQVEAAVVAVADKKNAQVKK